MFGSITEYIVSLVGELMLHTRWWDYSDKFLNINGRISLIYSIFWGLLGLYLLNVVNPKVDHMIDFFKTKFKNMKFAKTLTLLVIIFMFFDCVISGIALDCYLIRITVENNLEVENKEGTIAKYNYIYKENTKLADFINKMWNDKVMIKVYPNVTIRLSNGENVLAKNYLPDLKPYFFKFRKD